MGNCEYDTKKLHGNVVIGGVIECLSGISIAGAMDTIKIGDIDKPVIRHPLTGEPYIPGSSLKGKMRSIVEKAKGLKALRTIENKGNKLKRHECSDLEEALGCPLCRVFGSTGERNGGRNHPARLIVRDCNLKNKDYICRDGVYVMEIKMENTIDRLTSAAMPRTMERVPAGAEFQFQLIYKVESIGKGGEGKKLDKTILKDDLTNILDSLDIIEKDGLGGSVSRGYGRVKFTVKEFKYYDIGNQPSDGGFLGEVGHSIGECKKEIEKIIASLKM